MPPYNFNGIGRSNNYAENFVAASSFFKDSKTPGKSEYIYDLFTPVIPNSQLVIFANTHHFNEWTIELFTSPDQNLPLIMIGTGFLLFVSMIIIGVLHYKEK